MSAPVRIRLSRAKGWRMPPNTVKADRSTTWGNPFDFRPSDCCWLALGYGCRGDAAGRQEASVKAYREWIDPGEGRRVLEMERGVTWGGTEKIDIGPRFVVGAAPSHDDIRAALRGKNIGCWCALCPTHAAGRPFDVACAACAPCHVDVLGPIANRPFCEAVPAPAPGEGARP